MRAPDDIDPYAVLGLSPEVDDVVIRAAWKALIRKYHPDSSTAPDAPERAARINAAFKLLVTPEARATYDRRSAPAPMPRRQPAPMSAATAWPRELRPRRRFRAVRRFVLAGTVLALIGAAALYLARDDVNLPAPVQRMADRIITDPSVARMRANARRLLQLDTPSAYAAEAPGPGTEAGPPPPVNEAAIAGAIARFDVLSAQGGDAAATEGRNCVASEKNAPDWARLDACTALHLAGLGSAEGMFGPPDPNMRYFEQAALALPERYVAISDDNAAIAARIEVIRKITWSTMLRRWEARFREKRGLAGVRSAE